MTADVIPVKPVQSRAPVLWELVGAFSRGEPEQHVLIDCRRFRIGRREDLELCIPHMLVSALHAEFIQVGMVLFIRDLNSTNGTFVNGRRLMNRDVPLKVGDRVRVANIDLRLGRRRVEEVNGDTSILYDTAKEFCLDESRPREDTQV